MSLETARRITNLCFVISSVIFPIDDANAQTQAISPSAGAPDPSKTAETQLPPTPPPATSEAETALLSFTNWRIGGYGEMAFSYHDYDANRMTPSGATKSSRGTASIPRVVLAADYKFSQEWILSLEIEIEGGGTGVTREIEWAEEGGEYEIEIERGGEIALEQFRITRLIHPTFNLRAGHLVVPVGRINARHAPTQFFNVYRPEAETAILPTTWHENGIAAFGRVLGIDYILMVVAGLDPNGFRSQDWVSNGRQGAFEIDTFTSPAFVGRLSYGGVPGLTLGASAYYNRAAPNASKPQRTAEIDVDVAIATAEVQYQNETVIARASGIYGTLSDSAALTAINKRLPGSSGYPHTPVAKTALSYGAEVGCDLSSFFGPEAPRLIPFVRYEYYNPMEQTAEAILADKRYQAEAWSAGLNYFALPELVIKADWVSRRIGRGEYNTEHTASLGVAYAGWFFRQ